MKKRNPKQCLEDRLGALFIILEKPLTLHGPTLVAYVHQYNKLNIAYQKIFGKPYIP